jgi:hypothetical protein
MIIPRIDGRLFTILTMMIKNKTRLWMSVFGIAFAAVALAGAFYVNSLHGEIKLATLCWTHLQLLEYAKKEWAEMYHKTPNDAPPTAEDLQPFLGGGPGDLLPKCP